MTQALKWTLTLCLAVALTSAAAAQQRPGMFGPGGMLMNAKVQKELKLSDDQVDKLKDALGKVRDNHKDDFDKIREMSMQERTKMFKAINDESQKAIAGVLDGKQLKRFKQIEWQVAGADALRDAHLQKELKLSDEQKKKLDTIFNDSAKKMQSLFEGGNLEGAREKMQTIRKETGEKANGVLSEDQKKSFKELKGKPFEFERPRPAEKR
jgi:Spy/CpxP family protein refolding chaperone